MLVSNVLIVDACTHELKQKLKVTKANAYLRAASTVDKMAAEKAEKRVETTVASKADKSVVCSVE